MNVAVALDIGGTKIAGGLVGARGDLIRQARIACPAAQGPDAVLAAAAAIACELRDWACAEGLSVVACGVASAGVIDEDGRVAQATDAIAGWAGTDLRGAIETRIGLPTAAINDAHAMALAESRFGLGRGRASVLCVAVGTGIGGGFTHQGRVIHGASGVAGAIGHMPAPRRDGRRCPCGGLDHIEAYASGPAIAAAYAAITGADPAVALESVAQAARTGDLAAIQCLREAGEDLGLVLAGVMTFLDPEVVIVTGGVARVGAPFLDPLRASARRNALRGPGRVPIVESTLGEWAQVTGAAALVLA